MADTLVVAERDVARSEVLPLAIDFGNLGAAPTSPTGAIVNAKDGTTPAGVLGAVSVVNTDQVQAIVTCSGLTVGETYELRLTATLAANNTQTRVLLLRCVR